MAKQHFYSRVPARMSIFNRTDSFDTFAYSDGLEREFIEKDLSSLYDNKPSKTDATLIRRGELPPVYCSYFTRSGVLAQSCVSFLALDYTGERSAYLAHTLVLSEEEASAAADSPDTAMLNPAMFKKDLEGFNLTAPDAAPDSKYPELPYEVVNAPTTETLNKYDSAMLKRLLFAMLNLACGKGKNIYISLPYQVTNFSENALNFMNTVLQVFPYNLRRCFSFVTYTDEASRYPGCNIRFIPERAPEIPAAKGITLHFGPRITVGLTDDLVASCGPLVEFFYTLVRSDTIRHDFLKFMDFAVKQSPDNKKMNLKTLNELVFLFQQTSGYFNEKVIIPNDAKMFDYFCAYEKHREEMTHETRATALKCLQRYPQSHTAIPKDVFSKLSKIYPTENTLSKRIAMSVVLELIHTDVMRDKLFAFIKTVFEEELPQDKIMIVSDLARVYYGGFLQTQMIAFFDQIFKTVTKGSQDAILEKLLLTIRTESVKGKIIDFLDANYYALADYQKDNVFATIYEMLPECDSLSAQLVSLINRRMAEENDEERKSALEDKIFSFVLADEEKSELKMMSLFLSERGFCADAVAKKVLLKYDTAPVFDSFIDCLGKIDSVRRGVLLDDIWKCASGMSINTSNRIADFVIEATSRDEISQHADLYALMEENDSMQAHLTGSASERSFADKLLQTLIRPKLLAAIPMAFNIKRRRDGLEKFMQYASDKNFIKKSEKYALIASYQKIESSAKSNDPLAMIEAIEALPDKTIRPYAADHLKVRMIDSDALSSDNLKQMKVTLEALIGYMRSGEFDFIPIYNKLSSSASARELTSGKKVSQEDATEIGAKEAITAILTSANILYVSSLADEVKAAMTANTGALTKVMTTYAVSQKRGDKMLIHMIEAGKFDPSFTAITKEITEKIDMPSNGLLSKIFGKK